MKNNINGIDVSEYFIEVVDEGGGTIGYKLLPNSERLLVEKIFEQNQQLARLQKENEELKKELEIALKEEARWKSNSNNYEYIVKKQYTLIRQYEQQIEAYKLSENEAKEIIAELEYKNKDYLKQLDALKPENVYLHKTIKKYEQTLKEIKEIAEPVKKDICNNCGWQDSDGCEPEGCACNEFITILHKINEVINEK